MKKTLNTSSITSELTGASAFFKPTNTMPTAPPQPTQPPAPEAPREEQATQPTTKQADKQASNIASHMTILQLFDETDITTLREPAYQAQTFRLTQQEIEWVKDTAYRLSKEMRRKKVSQADILRISFKLFERILATNKAELLTILERIK